MYKQAWAKILNANSILLVSHINPDGDTIGSNLALYLALKSIGKDVNMYNFSSKIPRYLAFLPNINLIKNDFPDKKFDVAIACDCGGLDRTKLKKMDFTLINIDHHSTNDNFGDINIVNHNYPSATMVVYDLLIKNDILITKDMALCLYVGFVEDTGFFTYGKIDQNAMKMILHFTQSGLNLEEIGSKLRQKIPLSLVRLKQHVYDVFYLIQKATVGVIIITQEDLRKIGCIVEDTKNIANIILELATVKMVIMIVQKEYGGQKVSLRSKDGVNVGQIAKHFGGGGHIRSSGFEINENDAQKIVQKIIKLY